MKDIKKEMDLLMKGNDRVNCLREKYDEIFIDLNESFLSRLLDFDYDSMYEFKLDGEDLREVKKIKKAYKQMVIRIKHISFLDEFDMKKEKHLLNKLGVFAKYMYWQDRFYEVREYFENEESEHSDYYPMIVIFVDLIFSVGKGIVLSTYDIFYFLIRYSLAIKARKQVEVSPETEELFQHMKKIYLINNNNNNNNNLNRFLYLLDEEEKKVLKRKI